MNKTKMIRARVEPTLKRDAEIVLTKLGLTPTAAITLFYKQVTMVRGLPFAVRLPNAKTRKALRDARARQNLNEWPDVEALKASLD